MSNPMSLTGIKVLELASVLAGPGVGMFFAELGASVIKVENVITQGDVTRKWKLPSEDANNDISGYFSCVNWGKQSIALDLCHAEGLEIVYRLASLCDIVLVSYKPGDAEKLKVDYSTLRARNNSIIYAHLTGYGLQNARAGFDAIIQAETGFTYMNGEPDGSPTKMPVALMDILAAHQLKEAILLALYMKEKTGQGQFIEASLFKAGVASLANQATNWLVGNSIPQRLGSDHPNIVPYGTIFNTADGREIVLAVGTNKQFQQLVTLLGKPGLATDPRFMKNQDRVINKAVINQILQDEIIKYDRSSILKLLEIRSIPAGGVFNMQEVFQTPEAQPMLVAGAYTNGNEITGVRSVAFTTGGNNYDSSLSAPPHYGEHTRHLLKNLLEYTNESISQLIEEGVIYARD